MGNYILTGEILIIGADRGTGGRGETEKRGWEEFFEQQLAGLDITQLAMTKTR